MKTEKLSILRVPESMHRKLKIKAVQNGEKLSTFSERVIKAGMKSLAEKKEEVEQ
jgi:predicted HicB family RNase H-like nuclease